MTTATERELADAHLVAAEVAHNYRQVKVLPDGTVAALSDLLFTRAIHLGVDRDGWARRFCFEDQALADRRFAELTSEDDEPEGFVARRRA